MEAREELLEKQKAENLILYPASKGYIPKSLNKKEKAKVQI